MEKNNHKIIKSRIVAWLIVPSLLLLVWVILTLATIVNNDKSFLVLSQSLPTTVFTNVSTTPLLKHQKIKGEFTANENNLGIIAIRFEQKLRIPYEDEDQLIFRIKETGSNKWYYEGKYMSGLTFDVPFLPFGFPVIKDSYGKKYSFELESLSGNNQNGLIVSDNKPNLVARYQFSKNELVTNRTSFIIFAGKKFIESIKSLDILLSSLVYLMPFLLYIVMLLMRLKSLYALYASILLVMIIGEDIYLLQTSNDLLYIMAMVVWVISLKMQRRTSLYSFLCGIILMIVTPLFYAAGDVAGGLKSTYWAYAFFVCGSLQLLFGNIHLKPRNKN